MMTSFEQTAHVRCPLERPVPESRTRPCRIHGHLDFRTDGFIGYRSALAGLGLRRMDRERVARQKREKD